MIIDINNPFFFPDYLHFYRISIFLDPDKKKQTLGSGCAIHVKRATSSVSWAHLIISGPDQYFLAALELDSSSLFRNISSNY